MSKELEEIKFDERGLVPAIVQDARTHEVLTLAYMNAESLKLTQQSNETWLWSRSRSELWRKGSTSGNTQRVIEIRRDCDSDALVVLVEPAGPACHTGNRSCFYRHLAGAEIDPHFRHHLGAILEDLFRLIENRKQELPQGSYTTYLFTEGLDKILKKIGEEASETIIAAKNEAKSALVSETADLLYHLLVLLVERGVSLDEVQDELNRRRQEKGVASE
ncbi:MAG TPA: bifunctional phosphoribosyl-AMP cyclohydrolase/phosphoribosyl-ATP diphosphatase HisIE [Pyrinomonadaceae bacterium]|jgi:phosphoribosyl-ATP pyrophosphohydrolase/phosphoribosyl-AMP cyclohydrolase|nr:bifunctional phosphoribosyl-AMP cyclohydrolase/phosphoribosyl-ATP diphosphatase HisIE [Pyrinomonadaceae bacterium]